MRIRPNINFFPEEEDQDFIFEPYEDEDGDDAECKNVRR